MVVARFCTLFGLALATVLALVAVPLTGLFSDKAAIQSVAVDYLWIMAVSYGGYGLVMANCAAFNGLGTPLPAVAISAARVLLLFLPLAFLGRALIGLNGLFVAAALSNLSMAAVSFAWLGIRIRAAENPVSLPP